MRKRRITQYSIVALALFALPVAAAAQTDIFDIPPGPRRVDLTASGGFLLSTDWSDLTVLGSVSPTTGTVEQVLVRGLVVRPGPVFNAAVTYWEGRYGFRTHVGFAESCLTVGTSCGQIGGLGGATNSVDVNTWIYDVGGAIGLLDYRRGTWIWPFVFLGLGGVTYDLDQVVSPPLSFVERRPLPTTSGNIVIFA